MRALDLPYFQHGFIALAHRGGSLLASNVGRENTLAAFQAAVDLGYTHLETDVHVTADGQLVAFHDASLDRVSDASGLIAELTAAQLAEVTINGEPVPTLASLFEGFGDCWFNIDIKADGAEEPLARALAQHGMRDRVCVGSFNQRRLERFRSLAGSQVATSAGPAEVVAALVPGFAAVTRRPVAYQVPVRQEVGGIVVPIVTRRFVERAHRLGRQVHVWTIDDAAEMNRLIDLGVDGLVGRGLWAGR